MSLSQERPTNPAERFLKVKSGAVVYYDKESQENVTVPTPFEFIVLDQLATIRGWSDADGSGFWSNEVRKVGSDTLTFRTSKCIKESGIWRDIKGSADLSGAKYNASIYVAHASTNGLAIANFGLSGAALNAWIEFTQKNRVTNSKVVLKEWADAKKGAVSYKVTVFEAVPLTDAEKAEAVALDQELQAYFAEYFNYTPDSHTEAVGLTQDVVIDDIDDGPIDLSKIPF